MEYGVATSRNNRKAREGEQSRKSLDALQLAMECGYIILHFCEERNKGGSENLRKRCASHLAPFISLCVYAEK